MLLMMAKANAAVQVQHMMHREEVLPTHVGQEGSKLLFSQWKIPEYSQKYEWVLHLQAVNKMIIATGMH